MSGAGGRKVLVAASGSAVLLDIAGPLEVLSLAAAFGADYEVRLGVVEGETETMGTTLRLAGGTLLRDVHEPVDTLVVAGAARFPGPRPVVDEGLLREVIRLAPLCGRVASVCAGAFVLAEAGLLDGRRATTHWLWCPDLARRYPRVTVAADAIFVRDGKYASSAGMSAGIDLALALVEEDYGADLARQIARALVVFLQRPGGQTQFSVWMRGPSLQHPRLREVVDAIAADPGADHTVSVMADRAGLSVRHFVRVFSNELGLSPGRYVEQVRVEAARCMLESSDKCVRGIARACGFGTDESMRRAFVRAIGIAPSVYRARFSSTANTVSSKSVPT